MAREQPVVPFWFDLMYLYGTPVVDEPQARRFAALSELVPLEMVVPHAVTGEPDDHNLAAKPTRAASWPTSTTAP